jgi:hypothetical protein
MLERNEKEHVEEGERITTRGTGMPVKKWKDWEKGTKTRISKTKWRESKREGEKGNGRITE